jgi:hypothetical protein
MADISQVMTAAPVAATERSRSWAGLFNCRVPARMLLQSGSPPQQSFVSFLAIPLVILVQRAPHGDKKPAGTFAIA